MRSDTCVIFGAGEYYGAPVVPNGAFVVAADGGLDHVRELGVTADVVIGDFDSLTGRPPADGERTIALPAEKDDPDMLSALKIGWSHGCRTFHIHGGLGGRIDHTIANIQCLNYLKEHGASGRLIEAEEEVFLLRNETVTFDRKERGFLSLFSLGDRAEGVTIRNMKYLLNEAVVDNAFPVGVSNEFIGEAGSVTVKNGTLLVIVERPLPYSA